MKHALALVALTALLCGCSSPGAKPPPRQPERSPSVIERTADWEGEPPYEPPTATPPPEPPRQQPQPTSSPDQGPRAGLHQLFPGIRADLSAKTVEFDGTVPIDAHDPKTPHVFLEVIVCTPDTKEHEALVVTSVRPSDVHAALLAIGLEPGAPGSWKWEDEKLTPIPPRGSPVRITFLHTGPEGKRIETPAAEWFVNIEDLSPPSTSEGWFFAGSVMRIREGQQLYEADGAGTLIGLATFGTETIAWNRIFSPDSAVDEPEWIANTKTIPKMGTPVTVRIQAMPPPETEKAP